jgi:CO/xanthine dehydrogenase FAD-binding subunit
MKPAPFDYVRAQTVDDALAALAASDGAKVLAGGQSLVPMLNFRLVDAPVFVDINGIAELRGISGGPDGGLRIGALTRHRDIEISDEIATRYPVVREAMRHVAHLAIRNRGTIGGSLSHADPAAEWPALSVLLDAKMTAARPARRREIAARDFFVAPLTTALEDDEFLVHVDLPPLPAGAGWGFEEVAQRHGDFALAGAAAVIALDDGTISEARLAMFGVDETPLRIPAAEELLMGKQPDADALAAAAEAVRAAVSPMNDLHGSADYRRHLAGVLARRVLAAAAQRAA